MTVILFVSALMAKILSLSTLLTQAVIAWIRTSRSQAVTALAGRGVLRLRLQQLLLQATPRVGVPADAREVSFSFLVGYPKWKVRCSTAAVSLSEDAKV